MMKAPLVITKVGDDAIEGVAVLKKGSVAEGWGWEHIVAGNHHNDIKNAFGLADNDKAVKGFIAEGLEKGYKNPEKPVEIIWDTSNPEHKLLIVLSDIPTSSGSITTVHQIPK